VTRPEIDEPFYASADYGYGAEWQTVARKLKAISIDVAIPVSYAAPGDSQPATRPFGDVLKELASHFGAVARLGDQRPPPQRHAEEVRKLLVTLHAAAAGLENHYAGADNITLRGRTLTASELLRELIPELAQQHVELAAKDGRRDTPVATHTRYWLALIQLWWAIPGVARRQKNLIAFLIVCSRPIFSTATTQSAVASFVAKNYRRKNYRPK
jgi:hypothetical protein